MTKVSRRTYQITYPSKSRRVRRAPFSYPCVTSMTPFEALLKEAFFPLSFFRGFIHLEQCRLALFTVFCGGHQELKQPRASKCSENNIKGPSHLGLGHYRCGACRLQFSTSTGPPPVIPLSHCIFLIARRSLGAKKLKNAEVESATNVLMY